MAEKKNSKVAKSAKKNTKKAEPVIPVENRTSTDEHVNNYYQQNTLLKKERKESACVFVTGLPFGMTERNLRHFMQQFGELINCRVHSCPKTGRSRGYGYVQFKVAQVARIAAQTMNNHLITGSVIKCRLIPGQFIKDEFFSRGDRGYHSRIKKGIDKLNKTKRSADKEKKLLKKRQKSAMKHLSKLQNSDVTATDLGLPAHYATPTTPVVKKVVKPSEENVKPSEENVEPSQENVKPSKENGKPSKKVLKAKKKMQQPRRPERKSLVPKSLVLTRKGKAAQAKITKKSVKKVTK